MPTFTVRPGIYLTPTGDPATATQRWHRNGVEIVGASGTSYTTVSPSDDGELIEYVENVINGAGSAAEQRLTLQEAAAIPSPVNFVAGSYDAVWDPSDLSTLWQDAAGTVSVASDGDPVRRINDLSGNALHAIAPSDAARPIYRTNGTLHWLEFNGTSQYLLVTSPAFRFGDLSVFVALTQPANPSNDGRVFSFGSSAGDGDWFRADAASLNFGNGGVYIQVYANLGALSIWYDSSFDALLPASVVEYIKTTSTSALRTNGVTRATQAGPFTMDAAMTGNLWIGAREPVTNFASMNFYGAAIYSGHALASGDAVSVREYFAAKSGVAL